MSCNKKGLVASPVNSQASNLSTSSASGSCPEKAGKVFLPTWWPLLCVAILVGPIYGFKCRCFVSEGEIQDVYTVAHLNTKEGEAGPRTDEYSPLDERFAVAVKYKDLPPETELRASWFYLEKVGGKTDDKEEGKEEGKDGKVNNSEEGKKEQENESTLFRERPQVVRGTGAIFFSAPLRKAAWPTGEYEVRIQKNGQTVKKKKFKVFSDRRIKTFLYSSTQDNSAQPKEKLAEAHGEPQKKRKPVFSVNEDTIGLKIEVYNPKPGSLLRVMWRRRKKDKVSSKEKPTDSDFRGDTDYNFYSESDEIHIEESRRLFFVMPKARKGTYCKGEYKVTIIIDGKATETGFFRVKSP